MRKFRRLWSREDSAEREPLLKPVREVNTMASGDEEAPALNPSKDDRKAPPWSEIYSRQVALNLWVYTILACHTLAYDHLLPIFLHHPLQARDSPHIHLPLKFASGFGISKGFPILTREI
jgi:hypothetical protein